jgi:hypothetical protein
MRKSDQENGDVTSALTPIRAEGIVQMAKATRLNPAA